MGIKESIQRLHPAPLHTVLGLSATYFVVQLVVCHLTHSLTLLLASYHMLCNNIALIGCIMTLKYESTTPPLQSKCQDPVESNTENGEINTSDSSAIHACKEKPLTDEAKHAHRMRNTFGWTRIEVLTMLVVCVFFASLSFSVLVEALQTLIHIDHLDAMHQPLVVLTVAAVGLLLNGFTYFLIGGYTFHQGSFLHLTASGDVVLDSVVTSASVRQGQRRLSRSRRPVVPPAQLQGRQGLLEATRDVLSCLFVIGCSLIVYLTEQDVAKFVDPLIAIVSATLLLVLTYPLIRESGLILLQTIPESMNIDDLKAELIKAFPDIVNVHDFHVWQLTSSKIVATIHIIYLNPLDFAKQSDSVIDFLTDQGITLITIQPEFMSNNLDSDYKSNSPCLMRCNGKGCVSKHCCVTTATPTCVVPTAVLTEGEKKAEEHQCEDTPSENAIEVSC